MHSLTIDLPETLLLASGQSREEFLREARFFLALKLFEVGRLSSGKAAELCLMSRGELLFAASRAGVPVASMDEADAAEEFRDL